MTSSDPLIGAVETTPAGPRSQTLRFFVYGVSAFVMLATVLDLVGWIRHIAWLTTLRPGYATMKPDTAAGLFLLALALLFKRQPDPLKKRLAATQLFIGDIYAALVLTLGFATLLEYALRLNLHIDNLILAVPADALDAAPGRMSQGTAIGFTLLAVAFLTIDRARRTSVVTCFLGGLLALSALVGFAFNAGPLFGVPLLRSNAVHTATALFMLSIAAFAARPALEPLCSILLSTRRHLVQGWFFVATCVLPFVISFLILVPLRRGWYDASFSFALLVVLLIATQSLLIWKNSHALMLLEEKRITAERALVQNEKLAAMGRLAASVAHEINNPLESVTNLLYIARTTFDVADIHGYLDTAERELRRAAVISNRTLQFNRQSTHPIAVSADDMFDGILAIHHGRIVNSHITVERTKRTNTLIHCYDTEIRQVLGNLVGNAIDAMHPTGGRLLLRSRKATDPTTNRPGLVITVADTGPGMSQETAAKVFDAFFTTKGIGGTGLGLWISREIIDRHQGALHLRTSQSPAHPGTVFTLFLPCEAAPR